MLLLFRIFSITDRLPSRNQKIERPICTNFSGRVSKNYLLQKNTAKSLGTEAFQKSRTTHCDKTNVLQLHLFRCRIAVYGQNKKLFLLNGKMKQKLKTFENYIKAVEC